MNGTNNPKVSVIVPNYNHAEYLRLRLDSIFNQTFKDFEVIILDDFSSDDSLSLINSYCSHPSVAHIEVNSKNSGSAFKQWEKGIKLAKGEWIWIAESDDYADTSFLESMIALINKQTDIGLAYCDSVIVDSNNTRSQNTFADEKNKRYKTTRWSENFKNNGLNEIENFFLPDGTINNTSTVLFNKEILMKSNPFDNEFKYIGDKYVFLKVMSISWVLYNSKAMNYYRNPFTAKYSSKLLPLFYEQFMVFDWIYKNLNLPQKKFFDFFYSSARISLFRDWNLEKIKVIRRVIKLNPSLTASIIKFNLFAPIIERIR
jgi:glycosyltransferase involved in cell wall biosynthesis